MRVGQIILKEAIANAAGMKAAFDAGQWGNIICHFLKQRFENGDRGFLLGAADLSGFLGSYRGQGYFDRARRLWGDQMSDSATPGEWVGYAQRYGVNLNTGRPTWDDIYNAIAPYADEECGLEVPAAQDSLTARGPTNPNTPENFEQLQALMSGSQFPQTLTTVQQVQEYMRTFINAIADTESRIAQDSRGRDWWQLITGGSGGTSQNVPMRAWQQIYADLLEPGENGSVRLKSDVSRTDLDREIYQWLLIADRFVATARRS